jgi:hypothetical protein
MEMQLAGANMGGISISILHLAWVSLPLSFFFVLSASTVTRELTT